MTVSRTQRDAIVAVVDDLIFATKINATASSLGLAVTVMKSGGDVIGALDGTSVGLLIVDLDLPPGRAVAVIRAAAGHDSRPRILAYVSHVREDLARAAADAGADEVMPRSRFHRELPTILGDAGRTSSESRPE